MDKQELIKLIEEQLECYGYDDFGNGWNSACERIIEIVNDETDDGWASVKDGLPHVKYPGLFSGYCLVAFEDGTVCNTMVRYSQRGKKWITDDGITIIDVGYWKEIHPPKTNE
jgi:hypothetical protein